MIENILHDWRNVEHHEGVQGFLLMADRLGNVWCFLTDGSGGFLFSQRAAEPRGGASDGI